MQRTTEENAKRKQIIMTACEDTAAFMASQGYSVTPQQQQQLIARVGAHMADIQAHEPTEALDLLMCAAVMQATLEVLDHVPPADPLAWGLDLVAIAAETVRELLRSGGYPRPTESQHKLIHRGVTQKVDSIVRRGYAADPKAARQEVRDFAAVVLGVVLGDAPNQSNLN